MQPPFSSQRAIKRELIQKIYMFGAVFLTFYVSVSHKIHAWFYFVYGRAHDKKGSVKPSAVKAHKLIIMLGAIPKLFKHLFLRTWSELITPFFKIFPFRSGRLEVNSPLIFYTV